ncbi:MAG: prepilin-type N-terminal cleavage/methylation domain-containing protein [Longimicrobiales bacterium]|nr:prepilin-type N-terminal cleavage/methylation domain-containing protein [Longimicrobiales bacterium]
MSGFIENRRGFTLIELLIVIVIIGILSIIVWARFGGIYGESYEKSVMSDLRSVGLAQELYHQVHLRYGDLADLTAYKPTDGVTVTMNHVSGTGFAATATHAGLGGVVCGYYVGDVPPGTTGPAAEPGRAVCAP